MIDDEVAMTITGKYVLLPNPCMTEPCLPGMAYALQASGREYFLTAAGRWSDRTVAWNGWTPDVGDTVTATGRVARRTDVRGNAFLTIEVESLAPGG